MGEIIAFQESNVPFITLEEMVKKAHELAKNSEDVYWDAPHVQQRMKERQVTIRQILHVLREGKGIDGPTLDKYGDWRIKMKLFSAGRTVQVVLVVREDHLEIITVI